jgi:hypothetical protein
MTDKAKTLLKEVSLWKTRFNDSSRTLKGLYKGITRDAKKVYKELVK